MVAKNYKIIGAEFGLGAQIIGTEKAPKTIIDALEHEFESISLFFKFTSNTSDKEGHKVITYCKALSKLTFDTVKNNQIPIILGGDHSIAAGSWPGIIQAHDAQGEFGLIWIDAHMDSHTFDTSPSKAYHGMPLAALLGYGTKNFVDIAGTGPKINPKHLVLVGIRSYESEEQRLLESLGVKIFYAEEVHLKGIKAVLIEAREIASQAKCGYGVTIDLDFFDPKFAPGVGSPEPNGFDPEDFYQAFDSLYSQKLKGLEIVELNPLRDINNKTAIVAQKVLDTFFMLISK